MKPIVLISIHDLLHLWEKENEEAGKYVWLYKCQSWPCSVFVDTRQFCSRAGLVCGRTEGQKRDFKRSAARTAGRYQPLLASLIRLHPASGPPISPECFGTFLIPLGCFAPFFMQSANAPRFAG